MSDIDNDQDLELDQDQDQDQNEDQDQNINNDQDDQNQDGDDQNNDGDGENGDSEGDQGGKPKVTDKGTKLDDNPMSALNQQLANANRKLGGYEQLLTNPVQLEAYLNDLKGKNGGNEKKEDEIDIASLDPSKLETVEDVQEFAAKLQKGFMQKVAKIEGNLNQGAKTQQIKELGQKIESEISEVMSTVPELRETNPDGSKNPSFDPKLDKFIGDMYESIDLDKKTGMFKGSISFKYLASAVMAAVKYGESRAVKKAATTIIDKTHGRVITNQGGNSGVQVDESKMSAAGTIASRIARVAQSRGMK
jgi:hypothetical protein